MKNYRVRLDFGGVGAHSKQEAAELVKELISYGQETWTWEVKDLNDINDEGEDIEA